MNIKLFRNVLFAVLVSFFTIAPVSFAQDQPTAEQQSSIPQGEEAVLEDVAEQSPVDQTPLQEYSRARVLEVEQQEQEDILGSAQFYQKVKIQLVSGPEKNKELEVEFKDFVDSFSDKKLSKGDTVVVAKLQFGDEVQYEIVDRYRMPSVFILIGLFILLAIGLARLRGALAIVGLALTFIAILKLLIPQLLAGQNPLLITLGGAILIAVIVMYLTHGFSKRTSLALGSTVVTLLFATGMAIVFASMTKLFGLATEETVYVQTFFEGLINLKGLMLAGIILATLGILDDITISQTTAVQELATANNAYGFKELFQSGMRIGREHIASLINTLFLVYAGVSLPLFLLFSVKTNQPWWLLFNSEFITEEIVRTIVGSIALMLAVPISTALAAYYFGKKPAAPVLPIDFSPQQKPEQPKPEQATL